MLLGIVLHGLLPYFSRMVGFEPIWPADDDQSTLLFLVFDFIHTWRMPTFFLLAGFFAHLVLDRRSISVFVLDRLKRIALPLVLFGAVKSSLIPQPALPPHLHLPHTNTRAIIPPWRTTYPYIDPYPIRAPRAPINASLSVTFLSLPVDSPVTFSRFRVNPLSPGP